MRPMFQSQAGQDRFVYALAVEGLGITDGTFLDVGCSDPVVISNTWALEQVGWSGVLVDQNPHLAQAIAGSRPRSHFVLGDAARLNWRDALRGQTVFDYLSFDVDDSALSVLAAIPLDTVRFRIMTVEHDAYRFGDAPRTTMRERLRGLGYDLLCPDVRHEWNAFEDWWIDRELVPEAVAGPFRRYESVNWREIVGVT